MRFVVGLVIWVDDKTSLTSWFSSSDTESKSFTGVQLSKNDAGGLVVAYATGIGTANMLQYHTCKLNVGYLNLYFEVDEHRNFKISTRKYDYLISFQFPLSCESVTRGNAFK